MGTINRIFEFILLVLCLLSPVTIFSQNLSFEQTHWHFGEIAEDGGSVSHTFAMSNRGESPIVIVKADGSCGCTTSSYPVKPIMPGESGEVVVVYNPMDRPFDFNTTVRLLTSESAEPIKLSVSGSVTPRKRSVEEEYPFDMGEGLRFSANYIPLSYIEHGVSRGSSIAYINNSEQSVELELRPKLSSSIFEIDYPKSVEPQQRGVINFSYFTPKSSTLYGAVMDSFDIYVNGTKSRYPFTALGHVTDNFSGVSQQSSPRGVIALRTVKFGTIKRRGGVVVVENMIENIGVEPLIIRHIDIDSGLELSIDSGVEIASGETLTFEIRVDPAHFDYDMFTKSIVFTTNDAEQPMQRVRVNGVVER